VAAVMVLGDATQAGSVSGRSQNPPNVPIGSCNGKFLRTRRSPPRRLAQKPPGRPPPLVPLIYGPGPPVQFVQRVREDLIVQAASQQYDRESGQPGNADKRPLDGIYASGRCKRSSIRRMDTA
jgi:hypothetical protein